MLDSVSGGARASYLAKLELSRALVSGYDRDDADSWREQLGLRRLRNWQNVYQIRLELPVQGAARAGEGPQAIEEIILQNGGRPRGDGAGKYMAQMYRRLYFRRRDFVFVVKRDGHLAGPGALDAVIDGHYQYLCVECAEPLCLAVLAAVSQLIKQVFTLNLDTYKTVVVVDVNGNLGELVAGLEGSAVCNSSRFYSQLVQSQARLAREPLTHFSAILVRAQHTGFLELKEKHLILERMRKAQDHSSTLSSRQKFIAQRGRFLQQQRRKLEDWKVLQLFSAQGVQIRTYSEKYVSRMREKVRLLHRLCAKRQFAKHGGAAAKEPQGRVRAGEPTVLQKLIESGTFTSISRAAVAEGEATAEAREAAANDELEQFNVRERVQVAKDFQDFVVRLLFYRLSNAGCHIKYLADGEEISGVRFPTEVQQPPTDQSLEERIWLINELLGQREGLHSGLIFATETFVNQ